MSITENLKQLHSEIPPDINLICVSKFHSNEVILEAYGNGERNFGESRVQELLKKQSELPFDIRWHFIGPLQSNKIKQIVPFIYLIHSIETIKQIEEINKQAVKINRKINILLEIHIAQEENKHGFSEEEVINFFTEETWKNYSNVEICGLMGIATFTDNYKQISQEFNKLKCLFDTIKSIYKNNHFKELSIGMSDDYRLALKYGSTMIRIGSKIFGQRENK